MEASIWTNNVEPVLWTMLSYLFITLKTIADHIHELLLALIGTFVGAYLAFALEKRDRVRTEKTEKVAQGNLALFTLWQMWEVLNQYKKDVIDKAPKDNGQWLNMAATPHEQEHDLRFDPVKLYFLFEGKDLNILPQRILEQRRFYAAIILINRRSDLILNRIWPRLSDNGIQMSKQVYEEQRIHDIIGPGLLAEAKQLAPSLINNITKALVSFRETFCRLRTQLIEQFPGEMFRNVQFETESATETPVQKSESIK
jgi:hypothetical protein